MEGLTQTDQEFVTSLIKESSEYKQRAEAAEKALAEAGVRIQKCAHCGEMRQTLYRRDDLDGYVCLTCVEQYLDATLDKLSEAQKRAAVMRKALIYIAEQGCEGDGDDVCKDVPANTSITDYCTPCFANAHIPEDAGRDYVHRSELETVQRQAAAAHDALDQCAKVLDDLSTCSWDDTGDDKSGAIGDALEAAIAALKEDAGEAYIHEDNLDATNKQIAAMREALEACERCLRFTPSRLSDDHPLTESSLAISAAQKALQSDAGRDYVPMSDVQPLLYGLTESMCFLTNDYLELSAEGRLSMLSVNRSSALKCAKDGLNTWLAKHPAKGQK